jgi:hypothetical protein
MLSPGDARLVSRDGGVRGMGTLLDTSAFAQVLARAMPERRVVAACPTYIRYKPGTSCLVGFEVTVEGAGERPMTVYARAHADDGAKIGKSAGQERSGGRSESRAGVCAVEDPPLVIFTFPHDHELPVLARLFDRDDGPRLLGKAVPDGGFDWSSWELTRIRYKPERRFVGRAKGRDGTPLLVKALPREDAPACIARARSLRDDGPLRIARLLGAYERRGIVAWEWIEGSPLRASDTSSGRALEGAGIAGEALARLHAQSVDLPVLYAGAALAHVITSASEAIRAVSEGGPRAERIASRLSRDVARWPGELSALHGDFSASQVVLTQDGVGAALIDLDRAGRGAAPFDAGMFVANLEYLAMLRSVSRPDAEAVKRGLLEGYRHGGGTELRPHLASAAALGLLKLALEPFRVRHPEWERLLDVCLARAEAILDEA